MKELNQDMMEVVTSNYEPKGFLATVLGERGTSEYTTFWGYPDGSLELQRWSVSQHGGATYVVEANINAPEPADSVPDEAQVNPYRTRFQGGRYHKSGDIPYNPRVQL